MTVGGFAIGAIAAAIFAILINYVIQPQMSVETHDIYAVRGDRFNVWYHDGSPQRAGYVDLLARLEESLDELLTQLDVDPSVIPLPIDVLVHDDPDQLQASIVQRKSPLATHTFFSVLDLLAGEDPRARLVELVLAFGWGECFSQLLYSGTVTVLVHPDRNHHAAVAAAPERLRYSFEDLLSLEGSGAFSPTLYQQFDSPFSASMALGSLESIATFYTVFGTEGSLTPEEDFLSLQAASLVQYVIECSGGTDVLESVWGPGSSEALFGRVACGTLDELAESWHETAIAEGSTGVLYDYYRALYLFEAGEFMKAYGLTKEWRERELNEEELILGVRCALSVGEFEETMAWIGEIGSTADQVAEWIALFGGWRRVEQDGILVLSERSNEELTRLLAKVGEARIRIAAELGLGSDQLPPRMTVFFYDDAETRRAGRNLTPDVTMHQTAWHVVVGEDLGWILASTLPAYAYRISTASNLLRTGLATVATVGYEELAERGCQVVVSGDWTPLWQLGFGGVPPDLFRTESGLLVWYLVDTYGLDMIEDLWRATARLGGGMSLDSAMLELAGTSKREIEQALLNTVLVCD
jgi:hypothetical protein